MCSWLINFLINIHSALVMYYDRLGGKNKRAFNFKRYTSELLTVKHSCAVCYVLPCWISCKLAQFNSKILMTFKISCLIHMSHWLLILCSFVLVICDAFIHCYWLFLWLIMSNNDECMCFSILLLLSVFYSVFTLKFPLQYNSHTWW